jgi:hypothetical protein
MNGRKLVFGAMGLCFMFVGELSARELRYLGKKPAENRGWIEMERGHYYEVGEGDMIPGWGRVKKLDDYSIVLERALTELEKESMRSRGSLAYDVLEIEIPREDLRVIQPLR